MKRLVLLPRSYRVFEEYTEEYDEWYKRNKVVAENEVKAVKKTLPPGFSLEIGVGTGFFAYRLGIEYGVDPAEKPLLYARERGVEAVRALGEKLPFRNSAFDNSVLIVTICFLENPEPVLKEAWRVSRKGVVICFIPRESPWGRYYMRLKARGISVFYNYAKFYTFNEVESLLSNSGFIPRLYYSTLFFKPGEEPRLEEPRKGRSGGFVCVYAEKRLEEEMCG